MTAADDANLDELKRRARRRLVGAVVLALVVAVVVPMLLERDPKPLGEDVAVKIPPMDDGKFVNKLGEKAKAEPPKTTAKGDAKATPAPEVKESSRPESAPSDAASKAGANPDAAARTEPAKADAAPAAEAPAKSGAPVVAARAEPKPETAVAPAKTEPAKSDAKSEPAKSEAKSDVAHPPVAGIPAASPNGLFAVQVYAFSDQYGANSLVGKLKRAGYPAYSESTSTSKGTLWRVRIGPYASREVAATARDKLKGEGYNGIVTTK